MKIFFELRHKIKTCKLIPIRKYYSWRYKWLLHRYSAYISSQLQIGSGATIIGNIRIGDNVRIGANCSVTQDIPSNSTVVMPHPKIILKQNIQTNSFLHIKEFSQNDTETI